MTTIAAIKRAVARDYGVPLRTMTSPARYREVARPRQIAMFLARELTGASLPKLGRHFGGRDHTTVLHGTRVVGRLVVQDRDIAGRVAAIRAGLGG